MPVALEIIHDHLAKLPQRRSLDAALELFDALGYGYADELLYFIQKKRWLDGQLDYLHRHFQAHY
jgi:hypothetical protein